MIQNFLLKLPVFKYEGVDDMKSEFNIVLKEKQLDEGLNIEEICDMYDLLSGTEAIPVEFQGEYSTAMGFINRLDAEFMDYDYSGLRGFVIDILNNIENETSNGEYIFTSIPVDFDLYLSR